MKRDAIYCFCLRILFVLMLSVCLAAVPFPARCMNAADEVKMGREAAAEVEKANKVVTDPEPVERVNGIGRAVAKVANAEIVEASYGNSDVSRFDYKFRILDDEDVNAFSLPGGFVFINKGLLDYVQSDHELAGVLAHEVAHAAHHHMVCLLKQQSRIDSHIALVLLAGVLGKVDTADLGNVLIGAQLVKVARVSGYGQRAEMDADRTAVFYLAKAGYDPAGLLTFMERLARDYANKPQLDMGILQTHPPSVVRARNIIASIQSLGLPINRRSVTNAVKAVTEPVTIGGQTITQVRLGDKVLFEPAPIGDVLSSEQRAEAIAVKINQLLDSEPELREVRLGPHNETVLARGEPVVVVTDEDAALAGKSAVELARHVAEVLKLVIWQEWISRMY